jgi:hypothetical protein
VTCIKFSVMAHSRIGRRVKFTVSNLQTGVKFTVSNLQTRKVIPDAKAHQEFRQRLGMPAVLVVQQLLDEDAEENNLAHNNSCDREKTMKERNGATTMMKTQTLMKQSLTSKTRAARAVKSMMLTLGKIATSKLKCRPC